MDTARKILLVCILLVSLASLLIIHFVHESYSSAFLPDSKFSLGRHHDCEMQKMQAFKALLLRRNPVSFASPVPALVYKNRLIYKVTTYGADPTGKTDSTNAIEKAISDAMKITGNGFLINGIVNLGGVQIDLEGGYYIISRPLKLLAGRGNILIHGGTLKASDNFPAGGYLINISDTTKGGSFNTEFVTLRDLFLDSNFRGGGIVLVNALRTSIDNCFVTHFTTDGIFVQGGHETYIRNTFLGQHITAGEHPMERNFSGTAITLMGNDNAVTDVVIFSAEIGILISGQSNTIAGVHCYNKATPFGGVGIYLQLPGLTQTRIVHSYFDYTGIVAEDPVQLDISSCYFLGDGYVLLRSINGILNGVNILDNMFSGSNAGIEIVQLDQTNRPFRQIDQVVIDRNNVDGMTLKATIARGTMEGNGRFWSLDFNPILIFPNLIKYVEYTLSISGSSFPKHSLRDVSNNKVLVESDVPIQATLFAMVEQGRSYRASSSLVSNM